ncbi:MAG: phosphatidylserine decarboxylase [candidate division Zixibacteria bacterium]
MTKEGFLFPIPFLLLAVVAFYLFNRFVIFPLAYVSVVLFLLAFLVMLFFRDPQRKIPEGEKLVISPADGKVIKCEAGPVESTVSIFLSVLNVHVNRSPVTGSVKSVNFVKGRFLTAFKDRAQRENQRNEIEIETESGIVRFHQVTGAIARRTIFRPEPGEKVTVGKRVGLIRFGSRVDLTLPAGTTIEVRKGQKVVAGETIIGRLP